TAKMMAELGQPVAAAAVAKHYGDLLDGYLVDPVDVDAIACPGVRVVGAAILMTTLAEREALAREVLAFADSLHTRAETAGAHAWAGAAAGPGVPSKRTRRANSRQGARVPPGPT